jgi:hypothetical protein
MRSPAKRTLGYGGMQSVPCKLAPEWFDKFTNLNPG